MQGRYALCRPAHRVREVIHLDVFEKIRDRSSLQRREDVSILIVACQYDNLRVRADDLEFLGRLDAIHARHYEIHQSDIRDMLQRQTDGGLAGFSLSNHDQVGDRVEIGMYPLTDHIVIIHDQDCDRS